MSKKIQFTFHWLQWHDGSNARCVIMLTILTTHQFAQLQSIADFNNRIFRDFKGKQVNYIRSSVSICKLLCLMTTDGSLARRRWREEDVENRQVIAILTKKLISSLPTILIKPAIIINKQHKIKQH